MSEEKDRVDGTADETKAETKSSDHHTEDTYEKSLLHVPQTGEQSRKDDYPSGKHQYLPGLHAEEL